MKGSNYDVLVLRPQDITDVVDISKAIDLVEQGYRETQDFPLINAPRGRVHSRKNVRISNFPGGFGVIGSLTRREQVNHDATNQDYPYREHPVYLLWNSETALLQCIMIGEIAEKTSGGFKPHGVAHGGDKRRWLPPPRAPGRQGGGYLRQRRPSAAQSPRGAERKIKTYKVFSRNADNRRGFCARWRSWWTPNSCRSIRRERSRAAPMLSFARPTPKCRYSTARGLSRDSTS